MEPKHVILKRFPNRSWSVITSKASSLKIRRFHITGSKDCRFLCMIDRMKWDIKGRV